MMVQKCICLRQMLLRSHLLTPSITRSSVVTKRCSSGSSIPASLPHFIKDRVPKYLDGFNNIEELESANPDVQKIFSIDMAGHKELRLAIRTINEEHYKTALEKNIANRTCHIRMLTEQLKINRRDKKNKVFFIWLIDQRKKQLRRLQALDINKYTNIIKEFEIPPLESPHEPHNKYKFRQYKINVPIKRKRAIEDFEYDRNY